MTSQLTKNSSFSKAPVPQSSGWQPQNPLMMFLSLFKDSSFLMTSLQDLPDLWYLELFITSSSYLYTRSTILVYLKQGEFYREGLFGHLYPKTSLSGPEPAYPARKARFTVMCIPLSLPSQFQLDVSLTSTWTWLVLFQLAKDTHIFSPWWKEPPDGWRKFNTSISRSTLTSVRAAQFTSSLWSKVCSTLGIDHILITSYHLWSNCLVERFHRYLKSDLRSRDNLSSWISNLLLPSLVWGLSLKRIQVSSKSVYESPLTLSGEFLDASELQPSSFLGKTENAISGFSSTHHHTAPPSHLPPNLLRGKYIYVREDSTSPQPTLLYRGPYLVIEPEDKFFKLQIRSKVDTVSIDRLKPVFYTDPVLVAQPPPRGCLRIQDKPLPRATRSVPPTSDLNVQPPTLPFRVQPSKQAKSAPSLYPQ